MHSLRANPDSFRGLDTTSPAPALEPGAMLVDRYRLEREVGRTEAGVVFEAVDVDLDHRVAVEVASSIEEPQARRKWARDAMLAQRLEGEHVLRVLDVGNLDGGVPFAVREAALCTMAEEIEVKGALPMALAVAWTLEACEAVAEAHALGMAHGDLRLDNVYLVRGSAEPTVKVAWTSAAKAERAAKEDVARDLAGLGAMLRVLSTGRLTDDEADGAPTLPTDLAHAVARSLSIDPNERVQNVAELARLLAPYAPAGHPSARKIAFLMSRAGIVGRALPPDAEAPRTTPDRASFTDEWFGRAPRTPLRASLAPTRRPARPVFAMVSLALIALVLGGSWFLWETGKLPRWTGAAPPEAVDSTEVTSAPASTAQPAAAEPAAAEPAAAEPAAPAAAGAERSTTAAGTLPNATAPTAATPPHRAQAPVTTSTATSTPTATAAPTAATATAPAAPAPAPAPSISDTSSTSPFPTAPDTTPSSESTAPAPAPPSLGSPAPSTSATDPAPAQPAPVPGY